MSFLKITIFIFIFSLFSFFTSNDASARGVAAVVKPVAIEVNSYELFWPIVAGRVQGDSFYSFKLFKENLRARFIFSNLKKAEYNTVVSEKRIMEFEKLALVNKDFTNSAKTLDALKKAQSKTIDELELAKKEGLDVAQTTQTIKDAFDKETSLLQSILSKIDASQKSAVTEEISTLASLILKLK